MSSLSFISDLLRGINTAFDPLEKGLQSSDAFRKLMADLGWSLDVSADINDIQAAFAGVQNGIGNLKAALETLQNSKDDAARELAAIGNVSSNLRQIISTIEGLKATPNLPSPLNRGDFWPEFAHDLLWYLTYKYLEKRSSGLFALLHVAGVFTRTRLEASGADRLDYTRLEADWSRLIKMVSSPADLFSESYDWGGNFKYERLIDGLKASAEALGADAELKAGDLLDEYYDSASPFRNKFIELSIPLFHEKADNKPEADRVKVDLLIVPIPRKSNGDAPAGLSVFVRLSGKVPPQLPPHLKLEKDFANKQIRGEIYPEKCSLMVIPAQVAPTSGRAEISSRSPQGKWILLGSPGSSRLEVSQAVLSLDITGKMDNPEIKIALAAREAALALVLDEGDSFLQEIIGDKEQRVDLSFILSWSNLSGLAFNSQAKLETDIPLHASFGKALDLSSFSLGLSPSGADALALQSSISGKAALGPVTASVERVGIEARARVLSTATGRLGYLDVDFGFKPPTGLGITIDAGPITGGGFISFDKASGRYSGALQLKIYEISVSAIGILDTKLPGGGQRYSFIILIYGQFAPIQLGLGFTLSGVGGLAGIHRTVAVEALQLGIKDHKLGSILFPEDPVGNAPQIIADLSTVFPPATGKYVFGPMAIIGWGTPNIIQADIGLILELPDPVRLLILGQIKAALPSEDLALIELHVDVVGVIDFTNKHLAIDSTLHDSRILEFSISGDMALRLDWGETPNFALSVGGFNPHFQPPPGFPALQRMTLAIGWGPSELKIQAYFAITSNTLQFGGQVDFYVQEGIFNLKGMFGLDALIIYRPFHFTVDFRAGVALRLHSINLVGVSLDGQLSGPGRWNVRGEACVSLLFWDACVDFDLSWGEQRDEELPASDPWVLLKEAILDGRNWSASPPANAFRVVSLAPPAEVPGMIVDPVGGVSFHQKILPLNRKITKFAETKPLGPDRYNLDRVRIGPPGMEEIVSPSILQDFFAPAQFEDMTDSEKLSRPSFAKMDSGMSLAGDMVDAGNGLTRTSIYYETIILVEENLPRGEEGAPETKELYKLKHEHQLSMILKGAAANSPLQKKGFEKYANKMRKTVKFDDEAYVIVSTEDLSATDLGKDRAPLSKDAAYQILGDYLSQNPQEKNRLQVVPAAEVPA